MGLRAGPASREPCGLRPKARCHASPKRRRRHTWAFELTHEFRPFLTHSYEFWSDHDSLMSLTQTHESTHVVRSCDIADFLNRKLIMKIYGNLLNEIMKCEKSPRYSISLISILTLSLIMSGSHTSPSPPSRVPIICPFRIQLPRHSTSYIRSHVIDSRSHDAVLRAPEKVRSGSAD